MNDRCSDIIQRNRAIGDRTGVIAGLLAGEAAALAVLGIWAAVAGPGWSAAFSHAVAQFNLMLDELLAALAGAVAGFAAGTLASIFGDFETAEGTVITATFTAIAGLSAIAAPVAFSEGWWTFIAYLVIVAAALALAAAVVALFGNDNHDLAEISADQGEIHTAQHEWDALRSAVPRFCCPPEAGTRPVCGGA